MTKFLKENSEYSDFDLVFGFLLIDIEGTYYGYQTKLFLTEFMLK